MAIKVNPNILSITIQIISNTKKKFNFFPGGGVSVDQASLKLPEICLPQSLKCLLALKALATTPGINFFKN